MFQMDAKKKALLAQRVQRLKRASEEFDNAVNSAKKSKVGGAKEASRNSRAEKSVADVAPKENKFKAKLEGAEFRWINEQLYTTSGDHSKKLFEEEPSRFWSYHTGFRRQVSKWPVNPLDVLSKEIVELSKREGKPLIVADLGCGEAKLREKLMMDGNSSSFQVHSFDLVAANEHVIASDIADVLIPSNHSISSQHASKTFYCFRSGSIVQSIDRCRRIFAFSDGSKFRRIHH